VSAAERVKSLALELGFDLAGIAAAERAPRAEAFRDWLAAGHHADMAWLARDPERRADPRLVLPAARSVVVVGLAYHLAEPDPAVWDDPLRGRIARYAWRRDYHKVMAPMLRRLSSAIEGECPGAQCRAYADTGPVLEHEWAARAGLGFTGRNTLLIHPRLGSYLHLGVVLTTAELEPDPPPLDGGAAVLLPRADGRNARASCGNCRRCLDRCPTHAFPAAYVLNSRRCIAYQTIENRGSIPPDLRPGLGRWIFGCDECQSVCPYVKGFVRTAAHRARPVPVERLAPELPDLLRLDDAGFLARFAGTPVMRARRRGLQRNALVALGNSGRPEAAEVVADFLRGCEDPLLREHAEWARDRLSVPG
jgi:epoxyqueuosine reductase